MSRDDPHRLDITTEDSVSFSVRLASPVLRGLAVSLDLLLIFAAQSIFTSLIRFVEAIESDVAQALNILSFFLFYFGYPMLMEWTHSGRTLGKVLFHLRVVDIQGRRLTGPQIVIRNLFRVVDGFPVFYAVGGIAAFLSPRFQRLGDHAAGTLVIRTDTRGQPVTGLLQDQKFNSLRNHPRAEALLRRDTTPAEAALLVEALSRRDQLEPAARVTVYRDLADHFRAKTRFPAETLETLSDEAFLRNCLDTLARGRREL